MTTYEKIRLLLRIDNDYATCIFMQEAMGLHSTSVTEAQVAWVAYYAHVKREYITDTKPINSVDELDDENIEQDWDYLELIREFPEIEQFESTFQASYLLYKSTGRVTHRKEEIKTIADNFESKLKSYAQEILKENGKI